MTIQGPMSQHIQGNEHVLRISQLGLLCKYNQLISSICFD